MANELANIPRSGVLRLSVVTPLGAVVSTEADQVEAPSVNGEFGVLPGHRPLLAALRAGVVRYRSAGKTLAVAVGAGFAEVSPDAMTILTDRCLEPDAVDAGAARLELDAALKRLDAYHDDAESAEHAALSRQVEWLQAQVDLARESPRS